MTGKLLLESCSTFEKSKEEWIFLSKYNGSITNRLGNYRKPQNKIYFTFVLMNSIEIFIQALGLSEATC